MTQPKIDHQEAVHDYSIVPATIDGAPAWAFTVRPGDVQSWDQSEGNRGPNGQFNERAEISYAPAQGTLKGNSPYDVRDNTGKQTYDIDYRFKGGFPPHDAAKHEWAMITQFHVQDNNPSGFKGFNGVSIHSGKITLETPGQNGVYFVQEPVVTDKWLKRRLVVNWSSKADGYVKWIDRATGAVIGSYNGPTIAAGEYKYILQGYYRAGGLPEGVVYQSSPTGPSLDINAGDLTTAAAPPTPPPVTPPAVTPPATVGTQTVQTYAAQLAATRDVLRAEAAKIDALLSRP